MTSESSPSLASTVSLIFNTVPIVFRVPFLLNLVFLLWGVNLFVFDVFGIDYRTLLYGSFSSELYSKTNLKQGSYRPHIIRHYHVIYSSLLMNLIILVFYLLYHVNSSSTIGLLFPFLMYMFFALFFLVFPKCKCCSRALGSCEGCNCFVDQRSYFLDVLYDVFFPSTRHGVSFIEVLLGDVLTSVSKVFGDVVSTALLFSFLLHDLAYSGNGLFGYAPTTKKDSHQFLNVSSSILERNNNLLPPNLFQEEMNEHTTVLTALQPILISIPFILRLRQCVVQYYFEEKKSYKHLFNALKYFSALPVIWLSALIQYKKLLMAIEESEKFAGDEHLDLDKVPIVSTWHLSVNQELWFGVMAIDKTIEFDLGQIWYFSVSFNSFYSFLWDVVMDWGLFQLSTSQKHFLLRRKLLYQSKYIQSLNMKTEKFISTLTSSLSFSGLVSEPNANSNNLLAQDPSEEESFLPKSLSNALATSSIMRETAPEKNVTYAANKFRCCFHICSLSVAVYYLAIMIDFFLRILWSFKLSVHFQLSNEGRTFFFEVCEIFRRFIWIFLRVEWEAIVVFGKQSAGDLRMETSLQSNDDGDYDKAGHFAVNDEDNSRSGLQLDLEKANLTKIDNLIVNPALSVTSDADSEVRRRNRSRPRQRDPVFKNKKRQSSTSSTK